MRETAIGSYVPCSHFLNKKLFVLFSCCQSMNRRNYFFWILDSGHAIKIPFSYCQVHGQKFIHIKKWRLRTLLSSFFFKKKLRETASSGFWILDMLKNNNNKKKSIILLSFSRCCQPMASFSWILGSGHAKKYKYNNNNNKNFQNAYCI